MNYKKMQEINEYTIYAINNTVLDKLYIGCANTDKYCLGNRKADHLYKLRNNTHPNSDLQKDYNQYGEESFNICIPLEIVNKTKKEAMTDERFYMSILQTKGNNGYNRIYPGYKLKEETREKIRKSNSGENNHRYWEGKNRPDFSGKNHPCFNRTGSLNPMHGMSGSLSPTAKPTQCLQDNCCNKKIYGTRKECAEAHDITEQAVGYHTSGKAANPKFEFVENN
ncbi:NUMOD3 domain-containing DNA-binding protein [Aliifodinibius sp. S!AR15-10]|uniref:NUMOD3 domain-containing DNA-binding protein n=1 Tax=Aliifodinibius sp. S!AR15-10 TaxID=2950437 RepID=UPI00285610A3|nr:NUMOD3 domain-containing DNA-binding protein [Aliifodinibius sp. S!AR15-10]MDR8390974.1 NUMOD3 domain-containing DNA-binding protein [Aliifodinibius sp. S!AR15-10]